MKLIRLLEEHRCCLGDQSRSDNFGDGFLYKHNRIFRNVRQAALANGFSFSSTYDNAYFTLPYTQLNRILSRKVIPYVDNVAVVSELVKQLPESRWDDISDGLKRNHVFHEACHVVARVLSEKILPKAIGTDTESQRKMVLQFLLEESFANACELLGVNDVEDVPHRIFYQLNCYTPLFEERGRLKSLSEEVGESGLFQFMLLSYLHANFLHEALPEKSFDRVIELAFGPTKLPDAKNRKALRGTSKLAFTLDRRFRTVTTPFHLEMSGVTLTPEEIFSLDLVAAVNGNAGGNANYLSYLRSTSDLVNAKS